MAFEDTYKGIDFQAGNRMAMAQQQQLQQAIGQGMAQYNAGQDRELQRRQLDIKASKEDEFNLQKAAEQALYNKAQGLPYDEGAINAYSVFKGAPISVDPFGVARTGPTLAKRSNLEQVISPQPGAPSMAAPLGGGISPQSPPPPSLYRDQESFIQAKTPQVTGPLAGTPRGEIMQEQAGLEVQKEGIREERAAKNLMKYDQSQLESASFAHRMKTSNQIMDELSPDAALAKTGFVGGIAKVLTALPLGDTGTGLGDALIKIGATEEQQRYLNAAQNWVTANLRKESGAAIGIEEMAKDYAKYFPMPLDKPEVIADKKRLRQAAEKGMIGQSAGSYQLQFGKKAQALKDQKAKSQYTEGQTATGSDGRKLTFSGGKWR